MMKSKLSALVIMAMLVVGCASLPPRQQAAATLQTVLTTVEAARSLERAVCQPEAKDTDVVQVCGEQAHQLGLSDDAHQRLARLFATSFRQIASSSENFQKWSVPEAKPSLAQIIDTIHLAKVELDPLAAKSGAVQQVINTLDNALTLIAKIQGAK